MLFSILAAAVAVPLTFVTAIPVSETRAAAAVNTSHVEEVVGGVKPSGADAMREAFAKYGWELPTSASAQLLRSRAEAASETQTGTVQATDLPNDKAYYVNVKIGSQTFLLNMDTGSSDLWAFSKKVPKAQQGSHPLYNLGGKLVKGETWKISYAEGSGAKGIVYADKVAIGQVTATVQAVEAATSVSSSFTNSIQDGIVGLGFQVGNTCSPQYCFTFMQQVAPTLPQVIFTATLRHNAPGFYDFGFIDKSRYTGKINYNSLTGYLGGGFWEFTVGAYSVGSGAKKGSAMTFIADTGTSLLITEVDIVNDFYAPIPSAKYSDTYGGVVFPCAAANKLKPLSFYINNIKHTMPAAYGVYLQIGDAANTCFGGVQPNGGQGYTVMGDVFLKSQFVVFDVHTPQIGFAQQAGVTV